MMAINKSTPTIILNIFICFLVLNTDAQIIANDSLIFDHKKIYAHCLDANVKSALQLIELCSTKKISKKDKLLKLQFENRFKFPDDRSNYLEEKKSDVDKLITVFQIYWRQSLLDTSVDYTTTLISNLENFIYDTYPETKGTTIKNDSIDIYVKQYIESNGFHTTDAIGKTGKLYDLLVWKTEKDTTYTFKLNKEKIEARVIFMDDFITLGWEEYATLGKYSPGGWSTSKALHCVKKAYDLSSESFLISYLAHEGRHFSDFKLFPKLKSADLEYRAKLTELSMAKKTIYELIDFFINNANYESDNGHSIANYCVIRDLSKALFNVEFEKDLYKWERIEQSKINKTAYKILEANTKTMLLISTDIEKYIKN